jgi:hypothetical protein
VTEHDESWRPAWRFDIKHDSDGLAPGEPRRPFRMSRFSVSYRFPFPGSEAEEPIQRDTMKWQFIAFHPRRANALKKIEETLLRVIPEPDKETAVLAYTEGDYTILAFSPKAVNLTWVLLQANHAQECDRPFPEQADRLVLGDPEAWGDMLRPLPKRKR